MTKIILGCEIFKMPLKKMHANEAFNLPQLDQTMSSFNVEMTVSEAFITEKGNKSGCCIEKK